MNVSSCIYCGFAGKHWSAGHGEERHAAIVCRISVSQGIQAMLAGKPRNGCTYTSWWLRRQSLVRRRMVWRGMQRR